jgi:hypothetical protein
MAVEAQRVIESDPRLELVTPASLSILTFRRSGGHGDSDADVDLMNEQVVAALATAGDLLLTGTRLHGRYAIRMCVLNHTTAASDVAYALERIATVDVPRTMRPRRERAATQAGLELEWLSPPEIGTADLRRIPAFASISDDQGERFLATGQVEWHEPGGIVTARWSLARTFYVVASGRLSVRIGDDEVNVLGPGAHLGEIAAIDWGRDFAYGRTATVVATDRTRLVAFPAAALRELMAENSEVDRSIRSVAQARIGRR